MSCTVCPDWTNKEHRYFKQHVEESGCGGEARLANDPVAMNHPLEEANVEAGTGTGIGSDTGSEKNPD